MKAAALDAVEAAVAAGQLTEAARALLTLWREEPYAELADALDAFPARDTGVWEERATARMERWLSLWRRDDPLAVVDLLAQLHAMLGSEQARFLTPCFDALAASLPDPRVARRCVGWLLDGWTVLAPTRPLYRALEKTVKRHLDPRTLPELRRLGNDGTPWSSRIDALSPLAGAYRVLAEKAEETTRALEPLAGDLAAGLLALGRRASTAPLPAPASKDLLDVDTMLARIHEAPNDEAHRAVFRDRLLEASDPWGELIALQEARAKSGEGPKAREKSLLKELRPRILGSVALEKPSVLRDLEFSRGFLTGATVKLKGITRVNALLSRPELSTLERLTFLADASLTANLRALREAHRVPLEALAQAQKKHGELQLEAVTVKDASMGELTTARWWPALRRLRVLNLNHDVTDLFLLPVAKQLTEVGLGALWAETAFGHLDVGDLSRAPPSIQRVWFETMYGDDGLEILLTRDGRGWRAELHHARAASGYGSGDYSKVLRNIEHALQDAAEVVLGEGVPEVLRPLARSR